MKNLIFFTALIFVSLLFVAADAGINYAEEKAGTDKNAAVPGAKQILVAFFSHSGNTREIARQIHEKTGGDTFEIKTVQAYPKDYDAVVEQAKREQESGFKPPLAEKLKNADSYDVIFLGYPNWWGTIPMAVVTFLSENNFAGKTIVPFCTHEGSALGSSVRDIEKLCPKSSLMEGLAIRGRDAKAAQNDVTEWLKKIEIVK